MHELYRDITDLRQMLKKIIYHLSLHTQQSIADWFK